MLEIKLALKVATFEHRGMNVDKAAPSRAREGDVNAKMKGIKVDRA